MAARSHRLWRVALVADTPVTLAAVPAGEVWIVKQVRFVDTSDSSARFSLCVSSLDAEHAHFWRNVLGGGGIVTDSDWWVLEPGDTPVLQVESPGAATAWAWGARLQA